LIGLNAFDRSRRRRRWSRFNKMFNQIRRFVTPLQMRLRFGMTSLNKIFNRVGHFVQPDLCLFV